MNSAVLVSAWTVIPETTDPVWLASVPVTVTVAVGVAICGVIPVTEMARVGRVRAGRLVLNITGGGLRRRDGEDQAGRREQHGDQRTRHAEGTNDTAHGLHVMAVRYKALG